MSIVLVGSTSGSITLQEPAVAGTTVIDLPATSGTMVVTGGAQTIEFADGSAAAPSITNSGDTNTGIFFPAADTIAFTEGGAEAMRIDSSGNVGIGVTNPGNKVALPNNQYLAFQNSTGGETAYIGMTSANLLNFSDRMAIDSSGNLLVGCTAIPSSSVGGSAFQVAESGRRQLIQSTTTTSTRALQEFYNPNGNVGSINTSGSATNYVTSSDYRLKNTIAPMTGALAKVALLKPVTYKWNADGSDGEGFIAHELAEVVPQCVTGEKDAVDKDGNIKSQGIDTSFLVATLTAAIQELNAKVEAQAVRIAELEGVS